MRKGIAMKISSEIDKSVRGGMSENEARVMLKNRAIEQFKMLAGYIPLSVDKKEFTSENLVSVTYKHKSHNRTGWSIYVYEVKYQGDTVWVMEARDKLWKRFSREDTDIPF